MLVVIINKLQAKIYKLQASIYNLNVNSHRKQATIYKLNGDEVDWSNNVLSKFGGRSFE